MGLLIFQNFLSATKSLVEINKVIKKASIGCFLFCGASVYGVYLYKTHKKLVAIASCREDVYNRTGEQSVTFCEKGEARKRADDFLHKKSKQSELCFDVELVKGIEPPTCGLRYRCSTFEPHQHIQKELNGSF